LTFRALPSSSVPFKAWMAAWPPLVSISTKPKPHALPVSRLFGVRAKQITTARNLLKEQSMRQRRRINMGLMPLNEELIKLAILRESVC
jgi:hypothetical protein